MVNRVRKDALQFSKRLIREYIEYSVTIILKLSGLRVSRTISRSNIMLFGYIPSKIV